MPLRGVILKRVLVCGAAASGILSAGQAIAEEPTSTPSTVQEVVVTANKRIEKLHDVAEGITAVSGAQMQTRQEFDFTDFAAQVPGFNVQEQAPGQNREILRGQNSGGTGATVATLIDDVPLSFSGSDNKAALISTNLDTYDLQRVEVLKGPQGTLYGATAEGGVVKYVTNPPDLHSYHAGIEVGASTVAHGGDGGSVKGYVNLPFWQDKAALRITGFDEETPGYIDNPLLKTHDINQARKLGGRVSLLVTPTNDLSIRLGLMQQTLHADGDNEVNVVGAAFYPASTPANPFALANGYNESKYIEPTIKNTITYYTADVEYDLHWAKLSSISSFGTVKNSFVDDYTPTLVAPGVTIGQTLDGLYGQPTSLRARELESVNKTNQEFRLTSEPGLQLFGHQMDWLVGAFVTREDVTFNQFYDALAQPASGAPSTVLSPAAGGAFLPSRYEEWAVFGQVDYYLTPKFDVAVGARTSGNQEISHITLECCVLNGPTTALPLIKSDESSTTWSVAPRWHVTRDTLVYARVATGYRPGGPNLIIPGAPADFPLTYHSDSTINYEVGVRSALLHHTVSIDVAAYYVDWSQIQISTNFVSPTTGQTYGVVGNAGSATSEGLEWNLEWAPIHGLTFGLIGAYTEAHLTADAPGLGAHTGDDLPYVPKWSNTLNADYQWNPIGDYKAFVGGSWTFTGSRYNDFSSTSLGDPHVKLPSYDTLSLHAGIKKGPYTLELYGKNLTDSQGLAYYSGGNGYNATGLATLITPRTVGLRLAADF
ncbi:MAG: TonB-dependent receptor [Caulobacteraceae bacterium]